MPPLSPQILAPIAAVCFGTAASLLVWVIYQLLRSEKIEGYVASGTSMRRAENRRKAIASSPLLAMLVLVLKIPAGLISRMDLAPLRKYVRGPYTKAGYPGGFDDDEVVALGMLLSVLVGVFGVFSAGVFFGVASSWIGFLCAPAGFLVMVSSLQTRADLRQRQILTAMPYVLDLLVLILRSGTSLNIALARVVEDYQDHPVGEEMGQVLAEIQMGSPRTEALRRFAERMDHPDIRSLADSIMQSEELGWPLAETLARQSDRMAAERVLRAQAKAGAAGVIVMLPSTLVLLAAVLLLFGPIIVRFLRGGFVFR
jgi:tight adherence protein C